jgi:hypothetical protein
MIKLLLFIVITVSIPIAQSQETIAILDFETQAPISPIQKKFVSDNLSKQFIATGKYIVLDKWMVDTVLSVQGYNQSRACENVQCLLAIGQLLTVKKILGGSILKKGSNIELTAYLANVDANKLSNTATILIPVEQNKILESDITALFRKILNESNPEETKSLATRSFIETPDSIIPNNEVTPGKSLIQKKGFWIAAATGVAGLSASAFYLSKKKPKSNNGTPSSDISLSDWPTHSQ